MRVGVDTGGTFTDVVREDGRIVKLPSAPGAPEHAIEDVEDPWICHGTTIATNALLEHTGAAVALVTTAGFADVIEIARQERPSLYDPFVDRPDPIVRRVHRLEVDERLDARGVEMQPVREIPAVPDGVEAVAVALLHADLNPAHEQMLAAHYRAEGFDVSASHEVAPEMREYERTITTVLNAYLRPVCRTYLERLRAGRVDVMTSAGGLVPLERAKRLPVSLLLSGPAAGVIAAAAAATRCGFADAVSFDMGGTSTDVCLILQGRPDPAAQRTVAGYPVRLPSLDVHTIGAGGGSIAAVDQGGALRVGPSSAGARPGPACYGLGGRLPTVTDADLIAGHLPSGVELPGIGRLDAGAATDALGDLDAADVIAVVDAAMVEAVRAVTVRRGVDPSALALVAFGGAGPMHACAVAAALGMAAVVVPPAAGVLSATGLLQAPHQVDRVRSWPTPAQPAGLDEALADLAQEVVAELGETATGSQTALDCRYAGQGHELTVGTLDDFERAHHDRNGFTRPGTPVEVIALRATAWVDAPPSVSPPARRIEVDGPLAIAEADSTLWVPPGWAASVGADGSWIVRPA